MNCWQRIPRLDGWRNQSTARTVATKRNSARHRWAAARLQLQRTWRIVALSARNAVRYASSRVRRRFVGQQARDSIDRRFATQAANDVAEQLGNMKGVMMKVGQMVSFILETLPDEAQQSLSSLYADAPPMSAELAADVVANELGDAPAKLFLDWPAQPIAAASVGQVHKVVLHDGRLAAVKVQYPGVGNAITADLNNAQSMYAMLSMFALKGLDTKSLVNELRDRMIDELDYRIEAANQIEFESYYRHHPFITIPQVVSRFSTERVLTTEWVDGLSWNDFVANASTEARNRAGESIWRFAQHSLYHHGAFNGDPHPGNYRFQSDGSVTFLDFGLVKRWQPGEWNRLSPTLDAVIVHRDPEALAVAMEEVGFLVPHHGLSPQQIYDYVSAPYVPYLTDTFTFSRQFMKDTLDKMLDLKGPHAPVIEKLNIPASFVILDRVVWGVSAILGKLNVTAPWRAMLLEYQDGLAPATPLGEADQQWRFQYHRDGPLL
jgi:predicted unusual protein kinase regulating ubiquinone biosynthesis (AarF/ABC1/UbiB family)